MEREKVWGGFHWYCCWWWWYLSESRGVLRLVGGEFLDGAAALLDGGGVVHVARHQLDHALAETCLAHGCVWLGSRYGQDRISVSLGYR